MTTFQYPVPAPQASPTAMPQPADGDGVARLALHEKAQVRNAAVQAKRRYPGPVGELLSREIASWDEFGFRFAKDGLMNRVVAELNSPVAE